MKHIAIYYALAPFRLTVLRYYVQLRIYNYSYKSGVRLKAAILAGPTVSAPDTAHSWNDD
jgi:hypothetical protein